MQLAENNASDEHLISTRRAIFFSEWLQFSHINNYVELLYHEYIINGFVRL